jgi:hypothetical protein
MSEEMKPLKRLSHRMGVFANYQMYGFQYEGENGQRAWHITSWRSNHNPVKNYWVADRQFFAMSVSIGCDYENHTLLQTFGLVTDMKEEEKQAILNAICEWEKPAEVEATGGRVVGDYTKSRAL